MRVFRNLNDLPNFQNAVITIGTYDGVHIGHQSILKRINDSARSIEGESILVTFHPHPRMIVNDKKVSLLSTLEEKCDLLARYEVDNVVVVPFTRNFSQQSPQEYIEDFLVKNFQPKKIVIGYNHRFGKNRAGDIHLLREMRKSLNFEVEEISKQLVEDNSVSSTEIRNALEKGEVKTAVNLLGHPYFLQGIVVKGNQLGRKIGFPTANLSVDSEYKLIPENGVYAVKVKVREAWHKGMLNIGLRPTVSGDSKTIETNIFDFDEDIYGETIVLDFQHRIRAEQRFVNLDALIRQLKKDKERVLELLG
ncbi:MAG: bifunctional riboflavin kinase/FAD synthetase [Chitinophagales bacterium]